MNDTNDALTVTEAAAYLGIAADALQPPLGWRRSGVLLDRESAPVRPPRPGSLHRAAQGRDARRWLTARPDRSPPAHCPGAVSHASNRA